MPKIPARSLTYAAALEMVEKVRPSTMLLRDISIEHPPHPDLPVHPITQVKLVTVTHLMHIVGRAPGDFPLDRFNKAIRYRRLERQSLQWLEQCGIHAQRSYAPLAADDYIWLFGQKSRLPVPEDDAERFFSRLIHCLLIEIQILIAKQYFHGLGFYKKGSNLSRLDAVLRLSELARALPSKVEWEAGFNTANTVALDELHGKIFLEYFVVMIRAQWDKLVRLTNIVFGTRSDWDSIHDGLKALVQRRTNEENLNSWCRNHLQIFVEIAQDRLAKDGWLKRFRDPFLHDVGQHSAGVIPHKKSTDTTSEMWDRACDEHDWLREAMMATLVAFASVRTPSPNKPERALVAGIAIVKPPRKA
jgi:hypothetical protein